MTDLSPRRCATAAAATLIICVVFDTLLGEDSPVARHCVSVGAFLLAIIAAVTLLGCLVALLARRPRASNRR